MPGGSNLSILPSGVRKRQEPLAVVSEDVTLVKPAVHAAQSEKSPLWDRDHSPANRQRRSGDGAQLFHVFLPVTRGRTTIPPRMRAPSLPQPRPACPHHFPSAFLLRPPKEWRGEKRNEAAGGRPGRLRTAQDTLLRE